MKKAKPYLSRQLLINIYYTIVKPHFDYCSTVWDSVDMMLVDQLQPFTHVMFFLIWVGQLQLLRLFFGTPYQKNLKRRKVYQNLRHKLRNTTSALTTCKFAISR
jgi:hypothetical protein